MHFVRGRGGGSGRSLWGLVPPLQSPTGGGACKQAGWGRFSFGAYTSWPHFVWLFWAAVVLWPALGQGRDTGSYLLLPALLHLSGRELQLPGGKVAGLPLCLTWPLAMQAERSSSFVCSGQLLH